MAIFINHFGDGSVVNVVYSISNIQAFCTEKYISEEDQCSHLTSTVENIIDGLNVVLQAFAKKFNTSLQEHMKVTAVSHKTGNN